MNTFKIKPYTNKSTGSVSYRVSGTLKGKQIRENFRTPVLALTRKTALEYEQLNLPPLPAITTRLTDKQAAEAEAIYRRLEGKPYSLTQIVEWGITNYRPALNPAKLSAAITDFRAEREREDLRPDSLNNLRFRLAAFVKFMPPGIMVSDVLPDQISNFIFRPGKKKRGKRTIVNDRAALSNFFNWAVLKKYCAASPVESVQPPKMRGTRKPPAVFGLAQVRKLLAVARDYEEGRTIPFWVLGLFCMLRPKETARLGIRWDLIDLTKLKRIDVNEHIAKMGEYRYANIPDNAVEWLTPHALKKTPINITRKDFEAVTQLAGLRPWPKDVLRHTGVSNHLTQHKDAGLTVENAGHSITVMLKHYRNRITPEDADEYYKILPGTCGQPAIDLAAAAAA